MTFFKEHDIQSKAIDKTSILPLHIQLIETTLESEILKCKETGLMDQSKLTWL